MVTATHATPAQRVGHPKYHETISEENAATLAEVFKSMSDPNRIRIISMLRHHGGEICVFEIAEALGLAQPTISHHLKMLRHAGLVVGRKHGATCLLPAGGTGV